MTITALDRATGEPLATLSELGVVFPGSLNEWRLAKRVRPFFIRSGKLTSAQAACARYLLNA